MSLGETFFTLRRLTGSTRQDAGATFQQMAHHLDPAEEPTRVQFRLLGPEGSSCWTLALADKGWQVSAEETERPDFELITTSETWLQIAEGHVAPLRAFLQGKMRVRGDIELGKRLLHGLASSEPAEAERG